MSSSVCRSHHNILHWFLNFAFDSLPALWASAFESVDLVFAGSSVKTRRGPRHAFIDLDFARVAPVTRQTLAKKVVEMIGTSSTILTRGRLTLVDIKAIWFHAFSNFGVTGVTAFGFARAIGVNFALVNLVNFGNIVDICGIPRSRGYENMSGIRA